MNLYSPTFKEIYQRLTLYSAVEALNQKAYDEAIMFSTKSQSGAVDNSMFQIGHLIIGDAEHQLGNYVKARSAYQKFSMTSIDNSEFPWAVDAYASYGIAYTYFKEKNYGKAAQNLKIASEQLDQSNFPKASAFYKDAVLREQIVCLWSMTMMMPNISISRYMIISIPMMTMPFIIFC